MKEITRIHIAKVAYDAELEAKKQLEAYLKRLEAYSEDADILEDVEIRMTEILAERGVKSGGVITQKDVAAIKEQLGEPRDFMSDGDMAVGPDDEAQITTDSSRKLFRDMDHAVLGGVLGGIAAFFKVSPTVIRILFIIVALASFGTALLVYIVLWIAIPPAKTAADKLQMTGRPVTVSSIREMNETVVQSGQPPRPGDGTGVRILLAILGAFCIIGALGALLLTIAMTGAVVFGHQGHYLQMGDGAGFFIAAFVLAISSGLLLTTLLSLGAYASFAMRATKRVIISMCVVTVMGILAFATAIGLSHYASIRYDNAIKANIKETSIQIPQSADRATELRVEAGNMQVQYIVTAETPRVVVKTFGQHDAAKNIQLQREGNTLKLKGQKDSPSCDVFWCNGPFVTVYGPALERLSVDKKSNVDYAGENQTRLETTLDEGADVVISKGSIDTLVVNGKSGTELAAGAASVTHVVGVLDAGASIELGTVASLKLTAPNSCPAHSKAYIEVADISTDAFNVNNQPLPLHGVSMACIAVEIENREE